MKISELIDQLILHMSRGMDRPSKMEVPLHIQTELLEQMTQRYFWGEVDKFKEFTYSGVLFQISPTNEFKVEMKRKGNMNLGPKSVRFFEEWNAVTGGIKWFCDDPQSDQLTGPFDTKEEAVQYYIKIKGLK